MEFASVYSSLGHGVTVIEALDRILPTMDKEIAQNLKMIMKKRNVDIHTGAKVEEILQTEDGKGLYAAIRKRQTLRGQGGRHPYRYGTQGLYRRSYNR